MAYTEFYCDFATGANINAGDGAATVTTTTNGAYTQGGGAGGTDLFTAASGTPFSTAVAGDWVSCYADGATVATFGGRITAVNGGGASVDISLTAIWGTRPTTAGTGRSATIGGVWKGPNAAVSFPFGSMAATAVNTSGDYPRVNIKSGTTYSITAAMTHSVAGPITWEGYTTSAGDGGRAVIDGGTGGAGYVLLTLSGDNNVLRNLEFQNNGASGTSTGVAVSGGECFVEGLVVHDIRGAGAVFSGTGGGVLACESYECNQANTVNVGGMTFSGRLSVKNTISHDNVSSAIGFLVSGSMVSLSGCIAASNGGDGIVVSAASFAALDGCEFYDNGGDGLDMTTASAIGVLIINCNFISNGGWGVNSSGSSIRNGAIINCGFGAGTAANSSGTIATTCNALSISGSVTYGSDLTPWVDPANGDFRINLAAAKGTGRGTFTQTAPSYSGTVGYPDIGAAQHQDSGGSSASAYTTP